MPSSQNDFKTGFSKSQHYLCTRSQLKGGVTYVRTYGRACARVYVQSIYLVGGGLVIEANIPVQELEGQRGEGAYFREDTVYTVRVTGRSCHLQKFVMMTHSIVSISDFETSCC